MSEPLKIEILDRTDTEEFEQFKKLLKEFSIDTYIRNKPKFAELKGAQKTELVNRAINEFNKQSELMVLSREDLEQINKDILSQIDSAKKLIDNKDKKETETRYYILKENDQIAAFQQAQLIKSENTTIVEGWRNLAYTEEKYRKERAGYK